MHKAGDRKIGWGAVGLVVLALSAAVTATIGYLLFRIVTAQ